MASSFNEIETIMLVAITRDVSPSIINCELTHLPRVSINYALACDQHRRYREALESLGCQVVTLPAKEELPDAVFVEDVAVVLDEIAVLGRPGIPSRRPEVTSVAGVLQDYRSLVSIEPPGTLEGGDVLQVGKMIYVGLSGRTNQAGIDQLRGFLSGYGYTVKDVEVNGCLHLKSALTQVAGETLLINPRWVDQADFKGLGFIEVDEKEPYAANALLIGSNVIYPMSFPRTQERLAKQGISVSAVDVSELQKAEGAVTCCSLVFHVTTKVA
jgi:dimethylargininase